MLFTKVKLSASLADSNGVLPLVDPTSKQSMSFVANEVKIQGVSGGITNLRLDFVGLNYKKEDDLVKNKEVDSLSNVYLFESRLENPQGRCNCSHIICNNLNNLNLIPEAEKVLPASSPDLAMSACQAQCAGQDEEKSFFALRRKLMFAYSCICLSHLPAEGGRIGKNGLETIKLNTVHFQELLILLLFIVKSTNQT